MYRIRECPRREKRSCPGISAALHAALQLIYRRSKDSLHRRTIKISCSTNPAPIPAHTNDRLMRTAEGRCLCPLLFTLVLLALITVPALAATVTITAPQGNATSPQVVKVGVYVMDFKSFSVAEGTVQVNFYLSLKSDSPVSISDVEIFNGHTTSVDTLTDTPNEKYYRIFASIDADPDLRLYPFDRHALPIEIEPKTKDTGGMVFVINENQSGLDAEANLLGWQYGITDSYVEDHSYGAGETPYSRAVFHTAIRRDTASTILKFFLPIILIIIVSLSSLLMKVSSRLGLNASMFLAADFHFYSSRRYYPAVRR